MGKDNATINWIEISLISLYLYYSFLKLKPYEKIRRTLYQDVKTILKQAKQTAYRAVNFQWLLPYWQIGKRIVENEQGGKERPDYGDALIKDLSRKLTRDFGNGYSVPA